MRRIGRNQFALVSCYEHLAAATIRPCHPGKVDERPYSPPISLLHGHPFRAGSPAQEYQRDGGVVPPPLSPSVSKLYYL